MNLAPFLTSKTMPMTGAAAIRRTFSYAARRLFSRLCLTLALLAPGALASDFDLPLLGDTTSGIISQQQEYELGRAWLGMFRSRVDTLDDPILQIYLENLLFDLAQHSELRDHRLELIVVNNASMNAFAVPGGVVGTHTGLFRFSRTEAQLASVLAHEIAHLSQRHYARSLQASQSSAYTTMAGLLAGIILAATVGGDAGMAAIAGSQAAAMQNALRFSRQNEQEADRIGIETLFQSGRDPAAAPAMFEQMLAATRFSSTKLPEYLLTHPLTESRVADARNRANGYPARQYPVPEQYYLMRARALIHIDGNLQRSQKRFASELGGHSPSKTAAAYGLALTLSQQGNHDEALETLQPLLAGEPKNLVLRLAEVELLKNREQYDQALSKLDALTPLHGRHYAVQRARAEVLLKASRYQASERVLQALSEQRPRDPHVWYQLAEVSGLSGNISRLHQARAEYFILIGVLDKARQQLQYARKLVDNDYRRSAIIDQRLRDVMEMEERLKKL